MTVSHKRASPNFLRTRDPMAQGLRSCGGAASSLCESWCSMRHAESHCTSCKCQACLFCPRRTQSRLHSGDSGSSSGGSSSSGEFAAWLRDAARDGGLCPMSCWCSRTLEVEVGGGAPPYPLPSQFAVWRAQTEASTASACRAMPTPASYLAAIYPTSTLGTLAPAEAR